jgi:hypothetical protein
MQCMCIMMCLAAATGIVTGSQDYSWESIRFRSDFQLSQPQSLGLDAVSMVYPADSEPGKSLAEIVLVKASKDMQKTMEMQEADLINYLKTTFLGFYGAPESTVQRDIFGKPVTGERFRQSIPVKSNVEMFFVRLRNEDGLMIAFRMVPEMPVEDAEKLVRTITESMTETDAAM